MAGGGDSNTPNSSVSPSSRRGKRPLSLQPAISGPCGHLDVSSSRPCFLKAFSKASRPSSCSQGPKVATLTVAVAAEARQPRLQPSSKSPTTINGTDCVAKMRLISRRPRIAASCACIFSELRRKGCVCQKASASSISHVTSSSCAKCRDRSGASGTKLRARLSSISAVEPASRRIKGDHRPNHGSGVSAAPDHRQAAILST
mmetsp:Transcript_28467/g.46958  ORF Transcript_28467/g.46958 Transcript_28467/m.46958 type:complete len:202 (-) Transcript_28467:69-674(-)